MSGRSLIRAVISVHVTSPSPSPSPSARAWRAAHTSSAAMNAPAIPSVAFGQSVDSEGTSAVQHSSAESKRRQLLNPCTFSCRTVQIATISSLFASFSSSTHLLIVASKPAFGSNAEALSIFHPRSMLKSGTLSATGTISCEARTKSVQYGVQSAVLLGRKDSQSGNVYHRKLSVGR
jgi:hypothetical protein